MMLRLFTDDELQDLRSMPKRVTNPGARWIVKPGHRQRNYKAVGGSDTPARFTIYVRENLEDSQDFSCGIVFKPHSGPGLTLARYNGPSHRHGKIAYKPHVHTATAEAIAAGRKPESEAVERNDYSTVSGALRNLLIDFNLSGLQIPDPDQGTLI